MICTAVAAREDRVLVGGDFTNIGGQPRPHRYFAALDTTNGEAPDWDPGGGNMADVFLPAGDRLYAGGETPWNPGTEDVDAKACSCRYDYRLPLGRFSMRILGFGSALLIAFATTAALAAPNPTNLNVAVVGEEIRLGWTPPDPESANTRIRLLRRLNTAPTGPDDLSADVLATGTATQFVHPIVDLMPDIPASPRVYHYAVFGCDASGTVCETVGSHATLAPSLVQCLRGGGYTIFWRHADADVCVDRTDLGTAASTTVPDWWRSCVTDCGSATARQLNATGVQRATFIGDQIRALAGVEIGRVVSSEFCRCIQTAQSMAFGPAIETDQGITYFVYDEANRCAHCYERIAEVPTAGTNTAIIGHAGFFPPCPTLSALAWSECAVFKPDGAGGATLITRLPWDAWGDLTTAVLPIQGAEREVTLDVPREIAGGLRIRYRIASDAPLPIRLEVFDISGRRLWTARPGWQARGEYEDTWRGDELGGRVPGGVYLVRLKAGGIALSRKAVILGR